ncbi:MAG: F0F1 ATP synthase subunit A [Bacteriovoracales bacterium]|nr:F0F1 ATP synthase subunit A [Bacteriovoracales bacterium]
MKRCAFFLFVILFAPPVFAGSGFTWMGALIESLHLPKAFGPILTFALIGFFLALIGLIYRAKISRIENTVIPDKGVSFRNIVEAYGQFIYDQCKSVLGEGQAYKYFPFIATLFIFIFLSNIIGLIPGFLPPTEYLTTTFALGVLAFIYYNYKGCREVGTFNYLKHFAGPMLILAPLIFPIEILSNVIRPVSLALRLRGNMYGDHTVLSVFTDLAPGGLVIPVIFMFMGLLVSFIQAYVFTSLTMVYISLATAHHDHGEEGHH